MDPLGSLFEQLDAWRHFPAYQLERRVDAFFALYLREVLAEVTGVALSPIVIPELPLHHGTLWPGGSDQAARVDFALFAADRSRAYLVELKTDLGSRRDDQDAYLERAREVGMRPIVDAIARKILPASREKRKYVHLLAALARLGLVELSPELARTLFSERPRGSGKHIAASRVPNFRMPIEIVYVQPQRPDTAGATCIDFERFAEIVRRHADPFSDTFAAYLLRWRDPAARIAPEP